MIADYYHISSLEYQLFSPGIFLSQKEVFVFDCLSLTIRCSEYLLGTDVSFSSVNLPELKIVHFKYTALSNRCVVTNPLQVLVVQDNHLGLPKLVMDLLTTQV